jgi:hypothetical protein
METFRNRNGRRLCLVAVLLAFGSAATFSLEAGAQSNRCPSDEIAHGTDASAADVARIDSLWKDLHGPGAKGGDGPLGCPIGSPRISNDPKVLWNGIVQQFQRGWILIGRGSFASSEVALIRGLDSWTIWSKDLPSFVLPAVLAVTTKDSKPAAWARGGTFFVTPPGAGGHPMYLMQCSIHQTYLYSNTCPQLTPILDSPDRPYDAAARLNLDQLTTPNLKDFDRRVDALFPDWFPCHTRTPLAREVGEDAFARAMILMRRDAPCPMTGISPSGEAKAWLATLRFPGDMLPGTTIGKKFPCNGRNGELDVSLVQLLRLALNHKAALTGPVFDHIKGVLDPWGRGARNSPYVAPDASCAGFLFIETENHLLLQESASYLINSLMGRDTSASRDWLTKFLSQIARRDFYEFNSIPYSRYQLKALYVLHDHAPDPEVRTLARGLLDWLFAKEAVSGNLDRDQRPYRRIFGDAPLTPRDWWGSAATPVTTEAALFAGPLQHAHADIDLQLDHGLNEAGKPVLEDLINYPKLATAPSYVTEALVDASTTGYRYPEALTGWRERRFTREDANRSTYLQAINHTTKTAEDSAIFRQANSGAELVSGNRNWTIIAGGAPAPPGDPGDPPYAGGWEAGFTIGGIAGGAVAGAKIGSAFGPIGTAAGAVIGGIIGAIAGNKTPKQIALDKQDEALWDTQAATIRETTLIPTPVSLDRSQTIRFGRPIVTSRDAQVSRLCVAEGFMCGFDLRMPTRPFPASDALNCPINEPIPAALVSAFQLRVGTGQTITSLLGCQTKARGFLQDGNWSVWTFEKGMLAFGAADTPGAERFAGAWIEGRTVTERGRMRVAWDIRGDGYDWFRVHAYGRPIVATGKEPPGGWIEPLPVVGNAGDRTKEPSGDTSIPIPDITDPDLAPPSWDVLIVGCKKKYFIGILRGHDCVDHKMPRLTVDVGPLPQQSFSCSVPRPPVNLAFQAPPHEGIVMEVGSCKGGPYGLFVYVWSKACPGQNPSVSQVANGFCPEGASDYGFVVVAPSRGLKAEEFRNIVEVSMVRLRKSGVDYAPGLNAFVDVPISPPVQVSPPVQLGGPSGWIPTAPPTQHTVSFRWPQVDAASIVDDTGAPGLFSPTGLGGPPRTWPAALGHVSAHGIVGASAGLMRNPGNGCFTLAGYPTPADPNPLGLLVDFRDPKAPVVQDSRTSDLATLCP